MRKIILFGLVTFLVVSAAALSMTWFSRAAIIKNNVEAYLASYTTKNVEITYKAVEVTGFPFSMSVSIVEPRFTGHISKFIEELNMDKMFKLESLPEWNEDYTLNGAINLKVNALSNKFRIEIHGQFTGKGDIAGKTIAINNRPNGDSVCELQLRNSNWALGNLWNFYSLSNNSDKFMQDFRSVDCVAPSGTLVNNETKEALLNYGDSRIFIYRTPETNTSNIRFYVKFNDLEATKAYDSIYNAYQQALYPSQEAILPSVYGKQNVEIDIAYNGTEDWKNPDAKNIPLNITMNKFEISNNAYNTSANLSLTNSVKDNVRNVALSYKTEMTATELLRVLIHSQLRTMTNSILTNMIPAATETKEKLNSLSKENIDNLLYSIIPDFVSLDKITTAFDGDYTGNENFTTFQANLKSFEISATPYGLTSTGSFKQDAAGQLPYGNLSVECINCLSMIDDIVSYLERAKAALVVFSPNSAANASISPEYVKSFKGFLLALIPAEASGDKNNLKFDILNDGKGVMSINGKNSMEVMELFSKFNAEASQSIQNKVIVPIVPQKK